MAIPLALGFGMFVFTSLGDVYFSRGALAGLIAAFVAGCVNLLLGDRSTTVYAPRVTTTFLLGALLYALAHATEPGLADAPGFFVLLVLFSTVLLAGLFQALFGLLRLGSLIKFAPHPVMAGFQNMAAALLFLVQLGNVLGYGHNVPFTRALGHLAEAKPLSVVIAAITFAAMWHARRITTQMPPLLVGLGVGLAAYYGLALVGLSDVLGPTIGGREAVPIGQGLERVVQHAAALDAVLRHRRTQGDAHPLPLPFSAGPAPRARPMPPRRSCRIGGRL